MVKSTDTHPISATLYFLPVKTRLPLKFGAETLTEVTCARACVKVADSRGRTAEGWGETPLSVQWVWPSKIPYKERYEVLEQFCTQLAALWANCKLSGHPIEIGYDFQHAVLEPALKDFNRRERRGAEPLPWLAALLCCAPFDLALHDAYGELHRRPIYSTYNGDFMSRDLSHYLEPLLRSGVSFRGKYPADFLLEKPPKKLLAWHLVGGLDPLTRNGNGHPHDGYPVLLKQWIKTDGLKCLKIKLRGTDRNWDLRRLVQVGSIAAENRVIWISADFNCTVEDPDYVNSILDELRDRHPTIYGMLLYVEQPFPYDLEKHAIDVHSVSARKPLFLDESAHCWRFIRLGRELGWSGVALKTCKTQTGALLSGCWAKAHGMSLMVQDLTNPMLAQIPHVLLAAHIGTMMGVETNAMQFYPEASLPESKVHPGLYKRRGGTVNLSTLGRSGFGYQIKQITRDLPALAATFCS